jgi:hypothetical protein
MVQNIQIMVNEMFARQRYPFNPRQEKALIIQKVNAEEKAGVGISSVVDDAFGLGLIFNKLKKGDE